MKCDHTLVWKISNTCVQYLSIDKMGNTADLYFKAATGVLLPFLPVPRFTTGLHLALASTCKTRLSTREKRSPSFLPSFLSSFLSFFLPLDDQSNSCGRKRRGRDGTERIRPTGEVLNLVRIRRNFLSNYFSLVILSSLVFVFCFFHWRQLYFSGFYVNYLDPER